jgi:hypothetical protein
LTELTGLNKDFFDLFLSTYTQGDKKHGEKTLLEDLEEHGGVKETTTHIDNWGKTQLIFIMNDGERITYIPRHGKGIKVEDYLERFEIKGTGR